MVDKNATAEVVSYHRSKSIDLPVIKYTMPNRGLTVYVRNNYYNFAVTVESDIPIIGLTNIGHNEHSCYYEGFDRGGIPVYKETESIIGGGDNMSFLCGNFDSVFRDLML